MRSKEGRRAARYVVAVAIWTCGASTLTGCPYADTCWEVAACAPDPEPPPGPCAGEPGTAPALDECGVFVSEQGNDNSPGTKGAPVRTLQRAIGLAASGRSNGEAPTRRVYACGEAFEEAISLPPGVDLWGGRLCAGDWSYGGPLDGQSASTVIAPPVGVPVRVLGAGDAALEGNDATSMIFGVRAVAADASADGKSSIAMILEHGARAIVQSSVILAGDGKDGEPGEDAPSFRANAGVVGNNGADACTADMAPGAVPVVTVCGDGIESTGGQGGDGGLEAGRGGASGLPEPAGNPPNLGLGGSGAVGMDCKDGERGAVGADAERAAGAVGAGLLGLDGWVGVRGKDGDKGGVGQGGGGGGGGKGREPTRNACPTGRPQAGAAGGSGGSGGCGGKGGQGGGYGGASIAIVALQGSDLTVKASTVLGAKGGDGGVGGTGQWGGFGDAGGNGGRASLIEGSRGCRGGFGGDGGRGGDAGGGLGGHSLGIGSVGASVAILEDATVSPGQAGNGGIGANAAPESGLGQGQGGIKQFWYRFDTPEPEPPR
ncbi:DUF1565 domain-containing protein [Sorangium sp. So ce321]|uniref:DUF1565 domain-containing protein n=1 Tax=Sorangium sp. So ce321 TaxID=3133300 RepID=UPI003F62E7B2